MTEELKPCPFCGEKGIITYFSDLQWYQASCSNTECPCEHGPMGDKQEAIKYWNIRDQQKLRYLEHIVLCQAEDDGLWFIAETAKEAYLQDHLGNLYAAIEAEHLDDIKKILWINYLEKK